MQLRFLSPINSVSTILEKNGWYTLPDLEEKETLSPNAMLIRVMLPEALPDTPTLI